MYASPGTLKNVLSHQHERTIISRYHLTSLCLFFYKGLLPITPGSGNYSISVAASLTDTFTVFQPPCLTKPWLSLDFPTATTSGHRFNDSYFNELFSIFKKFVKQNVNFLKTSKIFMYFHQKLGILTEKSNFGLFSYRSKA